MAHTPVIEAEWPALSRSLWMATAQAAPDRPAVDGDVTCEVAIIGAGYTGLSAALHLAERGVSVRVLEAQTPGWGASGRNGGQVIPGLKEEPAAVKAHYGEPFGERVVALSAGAPDLVFELIERHAIPCAPVRKGWIQPRHNAASAPIQEERVAQWQARGAPVELLDRRGVADRLGSEAYQGGLIDHRGGAVQPLAYVRGLAAAAEAAGAIVHHLSPVTDLTSAAPPWRLSTPKGTVTALTVILATNAYGGATYHRTLDRLRRSVVPTSSVQIATQPLSQNVRRSILPGGQVASDTRRLLLYYRLDPDGRLVVGGRGAYTEAGVRRQQARLETIAASVFPQLGPCDFPYRWGGMVALTADHMPHLHRLAPGLLTGLGYNGRGIAMATAMGRVLADAASGTGDADLDFPFTPLRPIPFHALRRQVVMAVSGYYALKDRAA
ncbi:MAG: FAD-binding oxidoreductase [Pseudomonadota bacterium]